MANTAYSGSGTGQACAWSHPFIALPPDGTKRINGGDTLVIANGSYMMGYGAPGDDNCEIEFTYDCMMLPIPSGTASQPTRILGQNWNNGCGSKPEFYGVERPWAIIDLTKSNNVEIQCLEITDHSDCVEDHSGGLKCKRDSYPHGPWAATGILASDSSNVLLKNLNIHGLAVNGINAGRLTDWTLENVDIVANGWAGWDGDIEGTDSNSGTIAFKNVNVNWNGCAETYPGDQPTGCWGQTAGGYGDGLGTGQTAGNWIIEDSSFSHNTSDGLDLFYHRDGGTITVRRTIAEGNAGDQFKLAGDSTITDSVAISNCGYFDGKSFTHNVDECRSGGSAIALTFEGNSQMNLYNNSLYGEGDCLVIAESSSGAVQTVNSINNIFYGSKDYSGGDQTCLIWTNRSNINFNDDYSIIYNVKDQSSVCPSGSNDICQNPQFTKVLKDDFDLTLKSTSPAINSGYTWVGLTSPDFTGKSRPSTSPDRGAYEY
ncbi:hypothetical protein L6259_00045 [Candidatus Parcubacteria bacterium]|nr:hypothetical protein [Candidatus Parcubacteria bacterium]